MNHFTDHVAYLKVRASPPEHLAHSESLYFILHALLLPVRLECINAERTSSDACFRLNRESTLTCKSIKAFCIHQFPHS